MRADRIPTLKQTYRFEDERYPPIEGKPFGFWTVLDFCGFSKNHHPWFWCRCECGNERRLPFSAIYPGYGKRKWIVSHCGCKKLKDVVHRMKHPVHDLLPDSVLEMVREQMREVETDAYRIQRWEANRHRKYETPKKLWKEKKDYQDDAPLEDYLEGRTTLPKGVDLDDVLWMRDQRLKLNERLQRLQESTR